MMLLKIVLSTLLLVADVSSGRFIRQADLCQDSDTFQINPERAQVKPGGRLILQGNAGVPLERCMFYLPEARSKWPIDFSLGPASEATDRYEYFGIGLEYGDCGMLIKRVADDDDGIIQVAVLAAGSEDWEKSATTVRVTNLRDTELPVFDMDPCQKLIRLAKGDNITIECNADRPITLCHIFLPGPVFLNMDKGPDSKATSLYRYHGNGLDKGECGATLTGVDETLTGFAVCKVGSWPESLEGKWETDTVQFITKEFLTTHNLENRPVTTLSNKSRNATECLPLVSPSVEIACFFGGKPTDCSKPQKIRAEATMKCKPGFAVPSWTTHRKIRCMKGGDWDRSVIACQPDCGKRITNEGEPHISEGRNSTVGEFPWHVGIYQIYKNDLLQKCGGSLVTTSLVVTAAHCFWNEDQQRTRDPALYRVAAGKYTRLWDVTDAWVQRREVLEFIVPEGYHGLAAQFKSDIALVRLSSPFEITSAVNLVCVDWNQDFGRKQLTVGSEGIVTGWGFTETGSQSEVLQYLSLPYRPREECRDTLHIDSLPLLTEDKFCAGFRNEIKSVCRGDSGGGLVFLEPRTNKYYLRGVVSLAFKKGVQCNMQDYTGFTLFDEYQVWLSNHLKYDYGKLSTSVPSSHVPAARMPGRFAPSTLIPEPSTPTPEPSTPTSERSTAARTPVICYVTLAIAYLFNQLCT